MFTFSLAKELKMTVAELEERMSAKEYEYWKIYSIVEAKLQEDAQRKAEFAAKNK